MSTTLTTYIGPTALDWPPARLARYERLGAYFDRDREDLAYQRRKWANDHRSRAAHRAEMRRWARRAREDDAAKARGTELWGRRERLYAARAVVMQERIIAEGRIRPPGKTEASQRRYREQIRARLRNDPEHIELVGRYERANGLMERLRRRRAVEYFKAGVLAIDDRATRRRKWWAWASTAAEGGDDARAAGEPPES